MVVQLKIWIRIWIVIYIDMSILTQLYEYLNNFDLIFSSYKVTKLRLKMREISWTNQR